ncbi:MAG: 16S rRNA (cytosine(967)-C(5))-methyltransferase RsmB [Oscillospiraceae bacterium]
MSADARELAARCFLDVEKGAYSTLALKKRTSADAYDPREVRFAAALLYGTLERKLTLDYILETYLKEPVKSLDVQVAAALRIGLYQCLYMDFVPVRAAVGESVNLCKKLKKSSASGLVNAVLRKAADFDLSEIDDIGDALKRLSVKYSLCGGLVTMLKEQYGANCESIMEAMFGAKSAVFRINTLKITKEKLIELLTISKITAHESALENSVEAPFADIIGSDFVKKGLLRVQSIPAQLAVAALSPKSGDFVLDMCAAPGGKALTAAQMMGNNGQIIAADIYENRLKLIDGQAHAEGVKIIKTVLLDAQCGDFGGEFDRVLCDVPCSGYGEIAGKPELRYKEPDNLSPLIETQRRILANGARHTKKGGTLVYSTCTLNRDENEGVVDDFLEKNTAFHAVKPAALKNYIKTTDSCVKIVPDTHNNEGFFIATFERMC